MLPSSAFWKNNYEELITYYPRFYRDVLEMDAILRSEGRLADGIQDGIKTILSNSFVSTANEDTLTMLEKFLGLQLQKQRTVEERRRILMSFFVGMGKVSASRIVELIKAYTGADINCEFYPFDAEGNNRLDIKFDRGSEANIYIADIYTLLAKMLPAHIEYRAMVVYRYPVTVDKNIISYNYGYDLCGTLPDTALIADINISDVAVDKEITDTFVNYRSSSDSELTGSYPEKTTLADIDGTSAVSALTQTVCACSYIPCGTIYAG